jgi:hypothetical protein
VTPYRTASRSEAREVVLCPACAARVIVDGEDELYCRSCGVREAILRADGTPRTPIEVVDVKPSTYTELRAAVTALGHNGDCASFKVRSDGLIVEVGLNIDSGVARGVEYSISTAGLPAMILRREQHPDVDAKESGVAREVQTGDEAFDRAVYIESDAADEDVLAVLAAPAVRAAAMSALHYVPRIKIEGIAIRASDDDRPDCFGAERVAELITALRVFAGAPRRARATPAAPRTAPRKLASLVYLLMPLGIVATWIGSQSYPPVSYTNFIVFGSALAVVVAALIQPYLTRAVRGRSTSHRELVPLRFASFVGMVVFGIGFGVLLNGALDRSAPWTEDGVVDSTEHDDETGTSHVTIRAHTCSTQVTVEDAMKQVRRGCSAKLWLRGGAFGQAWKTQPAVVLTGNVPRPEK